MKVNTNKLVKEQLLHPRKDTRGYTRWWWYGCAVSQEEIERELDYMEEAGIGGVELQIMYSIYADDEKKGIKNQQYLSPGFFENIKFACESAKKRGLKFDLTLGSSWPYGGPFVPKEYSAPNVIPYTIDVKGPCKYQYDFTTRLYGECVACVMGKMENCEMIPQSIVDITDKVVDKYLFNWEWGKELTEIDIPEGDYKIVIFISNDKRQTVLKPMPNGDGLIIDHNSSEAARFFFKHAGDPIAAYVGEDMIQSYFCDSIEVFGQNWTNNIYEEFRTRRGYELRPYVYALWGDIQGLTDLIRYDFQRTLGELTVENFFWELTKWCHDKGSTSRIQAHGTWGDVLKAYGAADIPEGETFSAFDRYEVNTVHRKLASSAGHIYHKPIISNESFTWLRFPRFIVTLEIIKAAADSIFLDGMNQIVNHGYAYSSPESGALGWPFYASSQIDHKSTWWPYYKYLGTYFNRVCDFLQRGKTKIRLAVYLPQADIWAENPLSDIHMCMKLEERMTTAVVDRIHKSGFWFDYVNDDVLEAWNDYEYETLLFLDCDRVTVETARNVRDIAAGGTNIICKGHTPYKSCGLVDYKDNSQEVRQIFEEMCNQNSCLVSGNSVEDVVKMLSTCTKQDVRIKYHKDVIGYVHQETDETDIYFVSNISAAWNVEQFTFFNQENPFSVFDPMTAAEKKLNKLICEENHTIVELTMEPYQSLIFVFSPEMEDQHTLDVEQIEEHNIDLSKNWKLEIGSKKFEKEYDCLRSWEKEKSLMYYSGEGIYTKRFVISAEQWRRIGNVQYVYLNFEHIGETAAVHLNGEKAGDIFMRPHRINVAPFLCEGPNYLEIRVQNLLINCALDPTYPQKNYSEPVIDEWPYTTGKINQFRQEFVYNWRERDMIKEPVESGLWGKVWLSAVEK